MGCSLLIVHELVVTMHVDRNSNQNFAHVGKMVYIHENSGISSADFVEFVEKVGNRVQFEIEIASQIFQLQPIERIKAALFSIYCGGKNLKTWYAGIEKTILDKSTQRGVFDIFEMLDETKKFV